LPLEIHFLQPFWVEFLSGWEWLPS
jgi:hypothetical protein